MKFISKALLEKELSQIFSKLSFYILSFFFILVPSLYYFVYSDFFSFSKLIPITEFFSIIPFSYFLAIPFLSMLSWSHEGIFLELTPFSFAHILLTKLFASTFALLLLLISTLSIPFFASFFIAFESAQVFTAYIYVFFYAIFLLSLSQTCIILLKNTISSYILIAFAIIFINRFIDTPWAFKGIINLFELGIFLLLSFFFFLLSLFIKNYQKEKKHSKTRIVLILIIFILAFINLYLFSSNIDLTKNKVFSFSEKTKTILGNLEDELSIEFYLSPSLEKIYPQIKEVKDYIKLLEKNTNSFSKQKLNVKIINPEKLNTEEIKKRGLENQQIQRTQKGQTIFEDVYASIRLYYLDKTETIPFVLSLNGFEYNLITKMQKLIDGIENLVYILMNNKAGYENYSLLLNILSEEGFQAIDLESIGFENLDVKIPLIIIGSGNDSPMQNNWLPFIESFVMEGGRSIFFVSKNDIAFDSDWTGKAKKHNPLFDMLDYWGFEILDGLLIDLENHAHLPMQNLENMSIENLSYALWPEVKKEIQKNILCDALQSLRFYWPSPMKIWNEDSIKNLFLTSEHSLIQKADEEGSFITDPFVLKGYNYENQLRSEYVLAAIFEGEVLGYYSIGKSKPTKILVVPDEIFISNVLESIDSLRFLTNALLYFQDKTEFIQLKNKTQNQSAFKTHLDSKNFEEMQSLKTLGIFILVLSFFPIFIIGFIFFFKREKK